MSYSACQIGQLYPIAFFSYDNLAAVPQVKQTILSASAKKQAAQQAAEKKGPEAPPTPPVAREAAADRQTPEAPEAAPEAMAAPAVLREAAIGQANGEITVGSC
jgi:hypothetical protein